MNLYRLIYKSLFPLVIIIMLIFGCDENYLTEYPKVQVSEGTFWKNEKDALLGLSGCYYHVSGNGVYWRPFDVHWIMFDLWSDISQCIRPGAPSAWPNEGLYATEIQVREVWTTCYDHISRANYFLDNIDNVTMNETEKAEMKGEAKFLRAYCYFWLSQLWGDVPMPVTTLSFQEANTILQTPKQQIVDFALEELTQAAEDLPVRRPLTETGRVEKGAAMALKGRFLMAGQRWSEAAATYKAIMDLNRYIIDPRFDKLFEDQADNSDERIWSITYVEGENGNRITQQTMPPSAYQGTNHVQFFQEFVDQFLMTDGKPIDESPLYDPEHPYDNRDPRLAVTVLLPEYSVMPDGRLYQGHPDSLAKYGQMGGGVTGYNANKYWDTEYDGDMWSYGGDFAIFRYAEVLLSRIESELEAGTVITQDLLDRTINLVRQREEVDMPPVTVTNTEELREIIRRERLVELALEGIRYWDITRWGIADEVMSGTFHGMKITDNPSQYKGLYKVDDKGYLISITRSFLDHYYKWPIPLDEMDINQNLVQNPGYD